MAETAKSTIYGADTMVDFAYDGIRRDITEEVLHPGEKISLTFLCQRYGISATPIKQALNRLMVEGLVEAVPRKGCRIRNLNLHELNDLFEMRFMMEIFFAPKIAEAVMSSMELQSKFRDNLAENLALVKNFSTTEEYFKTYELDRQFHELYLMASGNQAAVRAYKNANTHTYAAYLFHKQPQSKTVDGILEHQKIFEALLSGDVEEVRRQVSIHNKNARVKIEMTIKLNKLMKEI